jgi:hypothetical protein
LLPWKSRLDGELHLFFEFALPSPRSYLEWIRKKDNLYERQLVPYVLHAAHVPGNDLVRSPLERGTLVDALLFSPKTRFSVLFEAKVLSDISGYVTYDETRNQIARNIDVMLFNDREANKLVCKGAINKGYFVLLTPDLFRHYPRSRLYGLLLPEYQWDPTALERDVPSRKEPHGWAEDVRHRIGWITWEKLHRKLSICPWFDDPTFSIFRAGTVPST